MTDERTDGRPIYDFQRIEKKWQDKWAADRLFEAPDLIDPANKFYLLVMFAYPSGDIHMGHFRNYIIGDAIARQQMMKGKTVLHPFGWDAFGLPAERAAIKHKRLPGEWTTENIAVSRETLKRVGISFDWSREISSCDPEYYKFTQWMFVELFKKGLAYRQRGFVNWCPEDKTVLANEQVVNGCCERCDTAVEKKEQEQWYFRITDYADRLIDDLDNLPEWPEAAKSIQREWIGRSYGLEVDFPLEGSDDKLAIFTTRPDTIFGVTFMAISPEAEILSRLSMTPEQAQQVADYRKKVAGRSDIERASANEEKDGVFTGQYAINPYSGERVELWVADYVLAGYGTGAVMAVPAHDTRDFAFAKRYNIPIRVVIKPKDADAAPPETMAEAFVDYGPMVNSGKFDGLSGTEAIEALSDHAEAQDFGRRKVNYKLKDWSISRQRYWGCPIPIIHCPACGLVPVEQTDLPVLLPTVQDYHPKGRSPLADVPEFMNVTCPKCGGEAERDPDTMDTFVCSSWYFLRYLDPHNDSEPFGRDPAKGWMPIDLYIGGISHATGHLIYFRFFTKFLKDIGWLDCDEPAKRLFNHGMVADADGAIMSKSRGNVVSPMQLVEDRGVDVSRLGMFFVGPSERPIPWSNDYLVGPEKFATTKLTGLIEYYRKSDPDLKHYFKPENLSAADRELYVKLNQTIKRVNESFDQLHFNTAIAALMELTRDFEAAKITDDQLNDQIVLKIIQMVAPLAPHLAEELWESAGFTESVFKSAWPEFDDDAIVGDSIELAVQVNGKLRATIKLPADSDKAAVIAAALKNERIQGHIAGKRIVKEIVVPGRLVNLVVK